MKKYILIASFIFVLVLGGVFMFSSKDAEAVVPVEPSYRWTVAWTPVANTTNYDIQVKTSTSTSLVLDKKGITTTTLDLTSIAKEGNTYEYRIRGNNAYGSSAWSNWFPIKPTALANTTVAKTTATVATTDIGYDFNGAKVDIANFKKVMKVLTATETAIKAAESKNASYVAFYKSAVTASQNLIAKPSDMTKATALVNAFTTLSKKETDLKNAIKNVNTKLEAMNALMSKANQTLSVFSPITRKCAYCPESTNNSGIISTNTDDYSFLDDLVFANYNPCFYRQGDSPSPNPIQVAKCAAAVAAQVTGQNPSLQP